MKRGGRILLTVLAVLLLASCGSPAGNEPPAMSPPALSEPPAAAPTAEPVYSPEPPAASPEDGGLLPHEYPPAPASEEPYADGGPPPAGAASSDAAPDIAALESAVRRMVDGYDGLWSVYFKRLDTGESFSVNDTPMVAASLIKLFVYGAVWKAIGEGRLDYDRCRDRLHDMISVSSNEACNSLIDDLGGLELVNEFIRERGYVDTQLNRKMLSGEPVENYTSGADCAKVFQEALAGAYVSEACSAELLRALADQVYTEKIPAGVPEGVATASKSGELSDVENDAAIVYAPFGTYILCVMSDDVYLGAATANIAALSENVYEFLDTLQS